MVIYRRWAEKVRPQTHNIILSNLNRFQKFFYWRFLGKFAVKWILKVPLHLAYVATLPRKTLMSAKQEINNKLQGSIAVWSAVQTCIWPS